MPVFFVVFLHQFVTSNALDASSVPVFPVVVPNQFWTSNSFDASFLPVFLVVVLRLQNFLVVLIPLFRENIDRTTICFLSKTEIINESE